MNGITKIDASDDMTPNEISAPGYSLLGDIEGAEKLFLAGRRSREADLESAVKIFLEFLRGFESFDFDGPCVTVFGSARFEEGHEFYDMARELGAALAKPTDTTESLMTRVDKLLLASKTSGKDCVSVESGV